MDGRECRIGNPRSWGGRLLGLRLGVFGTLGMHNPKVPQLDFSVQVVRHNLKIFCCGKLLGGIFPKWEKRIGVGPVCPRILLRHLAPLIGLNFAVLRICGNISARRDVVISWPDNRIELCLLPRRPVRDLLSYSCNERPMSLAALSAEILGHRHGFSFLVFLVFALWH